MSASVRERAHRILRKRPNYRALDRPDAVTPAYVADAKLLDGEHVLGVYENRPAEKADAVVVTDRGLRIFRSGWIFVPYVGIREVLTPALEDKHIVKEILLRVYNGALVAVPVTGGVGELRDAWEWLRFLRHVVQDLQGGDK